MKSDNPKISVIVPVYNAEKYLRRCIDSILNQTFTDFEVLLINDGSTDSSGVICDEYAKQDSRVRVFHKENGGVSSARNVGIQNMKGEYSIHCDSDDWIKVNMLDVLYNQAMISRADVIICDYYSSKKDTYIRIVQNPTTLDAKGVCRDILLGKLHGSTWNKLVKSNLIIKNKIKFNEQISYCEDVLFNVQLLLTNPSVFYVNKALYVYNQISGSITNSKLSYKNVEEFELYCDSIYFELDGIVELKRIFYYHVLRVKYMIINGGFTDYRKIKDFFSDSNKYIWKSELSLAIKILFWFIFNECYGTAKILNNLRMLKNKVL